MVSGDFRKSRLRPSTKFEVRRPSRSEDTAHLVCQLSVYNSFPASRTTIAKKSSFLRTAAFIFCLPWERPFGSHAKRWMNEKTIQCLPNPSQHIHIYFEQFPSYSNRKCKKSRFEVRGTTCCLYNTITIQFISTGNKSACRMPAVVSNNQTQF